jgi:phosphate transport system protein
MFERPARPVLDSKLAEIRDGILRLGSLVNQAVEKAIEAFADNDDDLAREVIQGDDEIDSLHHKLEELIISTVALQQPMAHDLRRLIAALLITNELERMGDYAEGIGRTVLRRDNKIEMVIPPVLTEMRMRVSQMIQEVMEAFLEESPEKARKAAEGDDMLDHSYRDLFNLMVGQMGQSQLAIDQGTYVLWAGHNLERIGDRVTNICERIVYTKTGDIGGLNPKGSKGASEEALE